MVAVSRVGTSAQYLSPIYVDNETSFPSHIYLHATAVEVERVYTHRQTSSDTVDWFKSPAHLLINLHTTTFPADDN